MYIDDITDNSENVKISFLNEINDLKIPTNVTYTPSCVLKCETLLEDFESIPFPCNCKGTCNFDCPCKSDAYIDGKLTPDYSNYTSKPIVECSDVCACDEDCGNRLVQHGIHFSLQVYLTKHKGFGVQSKDLIPKYSFICEYAGEIIDDSEAKQRMEKHAREEPNYIYVLNEHSSKNEYTQTIIDPTYIGNVGRYLNHSCSPNLITVPVRANSMIPRICFFAKADIAPYQELTYNYCGKFLDDKKCSDAVEQRECARVCLCQSLNCSGYLPFVDDNWLN